MLTATIFSVCFLVLVRVKGSALRHNETLEAGKNEVCMKELGCFSITDDFIHVLYRPKIVNFLPQDRATINTKFQLYTKNFTSEPHLLIAGDKSTFEDAHFNPKDPTKFIIHGYLDSIFYGEWMETLKDHLILHGLRNATEYNVIIVDWSGGNKFPYSQAVANTRVVGAEVALMVQALEKYTGMKREDCHIIGHSLGSHIAGYAGERLKRLGRITGCDPAAPFFENMPPSVRLDPTDADFVDVIHSDAINTLRIGLGMSQSVGHVDFYPNGGRNQPGCKTEQVISFFDKGFEEGKRRLFSCNHQRSLDFFYRSINYNKVVPVGYECSSWEDFVKGKCAECGTDTKKCAIMGMRADEYRQFRNSSVQRKMYLKTSGTSPFWLYHYQVSIKLFKPKTSYKDVKGTININLVGSKADVSFDLQHQELFHGAQYKHLATTDKDLGVVKGVSLRWDTSFTIFSKPKLYVEYISVIPMNVIEPSPRNMTNRIFCDKKDNAIPPRTTANFFNDKKCI